MKMRALWFPALLLVAAGCSHNRLEPAPELKVVKGGLPAPSLADIAPPPREYVLAPGDFVAVKVFGLPAASLERVQIDNSGDIAVPLAGSFLANGKTPAQLSLEVEDRLRVAHVRNPQVAVNILETKSQLVTVDGEVTQPGQYPVLGRMTLSRAVASAQGVTRFADTNYVVIFRTVNQQHYAALYDLRAIRSGAIADPEVFSGDNVVVGESRARRIFSDVLAASPLLVAPIITLLQR
jgi:polysaccharide biosynthesis/export protein